MESLEVVSEKSKKGEDSHWLLSVSASMASVFSIFIPIILTRLLSIDEVGIYKNLFLYLSLAIGLSLTAGYLTTLSFLAGSPEHAKERVSSSIAQMVLLACIAAVFAYFAAPTYSLLFSLAFGLSCVHVVWEEVLVANGRVKTAAKFTVAFELLRSFALPFVAFFFPSVQSLLLAYVLVSVLKVCSGLTIILREGLIAANFSGKEVWFTARLALPISLSWFLGSFADRMDQLILTGLVPASEFAIYSLGCLVIPPLLVFETSIMKVCVSKISKMLQGGEKQLAIASIRTSISELALLVIPSSLFLAFNSKAIVHLLFTPKFSAAALFLATYSLYYLVLLFPGDLILRALGRSKELVWLNVIGAAGSLFCCWIGYQVYGQLGLLYGFILCRFSVRLYGIWLGTRIIEVPLHSVLPIHFYLKASFLIAPVWLLYALFDPGFVEGMLICSLAFIWLLYCLISQTLTDKTRVLVLQNSETKVVPGLALREFASAAVTSRLIDDEAPVGFFGSLLRGIKLAMEILSEGACSVYIFSSRDLLAATFAREILFGRVKIFYFTDDLKMEFSKQLIPRYCLAHLAGICVDMANTPHQDITNALEQEFVIYDYSAVSIDAFKS